MIPSETPCYCSICNQPLPPIGTAVATGSNSSEEDTATHVCVCSGYCIGVTYASNIKYVDDGAKKKEKPQKGHFRKQFGGVGQRLDKRFR